MPEDVTIVHGPGTGTIVMGQPDQLTLWTPRLEAAVFEALDTLAEDPAVRVIGWRGVGRAFCAGADLNDLQGRMGTLLGDGVEGILGRRVTRILDLPKPVVVGIHGPCVGIAFALALTCDIRLVATDVMFQAAFAHRGLAAEHGSSWLLPRIVGVGHALDILLGNSAVLADRAVAVGLASHAVAAADLPQTLDETIRRMAADLSPAAMARIKRQVRQDLHRTRADAITASASEMLDALDSPDAAEGVTSFVQRRTPTYPPLGGGQFVDP